MRRLQCNYYEQATPQKRPSVIDVVVILSKNKRDAKRRLVDAQRKHPILITVIMHSASSPRPSLQTGPISNCKLKTIFVNSTKYTKYTIPVCIHCTCRVCVYDVLTNPEHRGGTSYEKLRGRKSARKNFAGALSLFQFAPHFLGGHMSFLPSS